MIENWYHEAACSIAGAGCNIKLVIQKIESIADRGIFIVYLALAVITPLLFSTRNSELFEVPKMLFVYFAAVLIATLAHIKFAALKKHPYPLNLVFISFVILFVTQVVSTFTSIDKFTSIYGYPSRLNGGILSLFAYLIVFFGTLNLSREKIQTLLQAAVISALAVSLWGIPGHFGYDPNCLILSGQLTSSCWQKEFDPTLRIFSTLGQPNWLASYLVLIIPISIAQIFIAKKKSAIVFFLISTIFILIALIFTNSRAGIAGFIASLVVFVLILGKQNIAKFKKVIVPLFILSAVVGIIFGASLVSRAKEALGQTSSPGTESGAIRLIVWRGAIDVFKNYPLLGTGPETFAYSYYKVRPLEHNQTTEWNFFYNKAHNEFLNYLANTGVFGFSAYIFFLTATLFTLFRISKQKDEEVSLISKAVFASLVGYQITIFFGFSTVATQLLMFLQVGSSLVLGKKENLKYVNLKFLNEKTQLAAFALVIIIGSVGIAYAARLYAADVFYSQKSFNTAIKLFPSNNPFYLADSAYSTVLSMDTKQVLDQTRTALETSPSNLLVMRKVANTYLLVAQSDKQYEQLALDTGQKMMALAPSDPQTYLAFAKIQVGVDQNEAAKKTLKKVLELKPDYAEAQELLDQLNRNQQPETSE
ncbi:MAG: O-antigen ligase family protein [Candidatus Curtissbacteria bacterium]|nr:O-antigen ligase family protein [Candidatus Curtissbacteria bacterium]